MAEASAVFSVSPTMTPAEATAKLAEMSAAYAAAPPAIQATTPVQASQRLAQLGESPDFLRKLQSGDAETVREWNRLSELKAAATIADAFTDNPQLVEVTQGDTGLTSRNLISAAADLRAVGIPDEGIEAIIAGRPFPEADVAAAHDLLAQAMASEEWKAKFKDGDPICIHDWTTWCAIIGRGSGESA
jgi:hypothetical protein